MTKYVALVFCRTHTSLDKYLPMPKGTTTLHSFMKKDAPGQFWEAECDLDLMNEGEKRQLMGWAISQGLRVTYNNHYYTAAGVIRKQSDGGPQGSTLLWRTEKCICLPLIGSTRRSLRDWASICC